MLLCIVQLEEMKTVNGKSLAKFYDDFNEETEEFEKFNLGNRVEGQEMFELDRRDLLESVVLYTFAGASIHSSQTPFF